MSANEELKAKVAKYLEENKVMMLSQISQALEITDLDVAKAMSNDMCALSSAENFEAIWDTACEWEKCTFIMVHLGSVLEIQGKLSKGKKGGPYYNVSQENGTSIGGHIKIDDLEAIGFVSMPFMNLESHHLAFFNKEGEIKFTVYVGRENKKLIESVRQSFLQMKNTYCGE